MTARVNDSGVTPGPLLVAGVLASPALWRALQQHELPLYVALERLLIIAVLCVIVGDVVRRYLDVVPAPAGVAAEEPAAAPASPSPSPIEQTPEWGSGDLGGTDLFALDPLPGADLEPLNDESIV